MPGTGQVGVAGRLGSHLLFTPCGGDDPSAENVEVDERFRKVRQPSKSAGRRRASHSQA